MQVNKGDHSAFKGIDDLVQLGLKASPFDSLTVATVGGGPEGGAPTIKSSKSSIESSSDLKTAYAATVAAQGSYGAFSGAASVSAATNSHLTSRSSVYVLNYDASFPAVVLDESKTKLHPTAIKLLKEDPGQFKVQFGSHYIAGYETGCQSTVKVTVTAKTDAQKAEMDASAKAKYASIASGSGEFHAAMEKSSAIESISVDITNIGTNNLPTALTETKQVKEMIETPLSNGQGCTQQSSTVLRIIVKPWVSNHEVAMNITPEGRAALMPKGMYAADLEDLNLLMMQVTGLKEHASKCSNNVFGCTTKAWTEKAENRQKLYQYANEQLLVLLNDLKHLRESDLIIDSAAILNRQHRVDQIYRTFIRPASVMSTLTFKFNGWLTSKWSSSRKNYKGSYKRDNSETWDLELKVDPNRLQAATGTIAQKQLDNDHSWPNWVTGTFFAKYLDGKLEVWQCWVRHAPFGSDKCEDTIVIYPGESQSRVQNGIDDVNADYSFLVEYGNPFQDEQNPGGGSGGVGGENS